MPPCSLKQSFLFTIPIAAGFAWLEMSSTLSFLSFPEHLACELEEHLLTHACTTETEEGTASVLGKLNRGEARAVRENAE